MSAVRRHGSVVPPFPDARGTAAHDLGEGRLVEGLPNGRPQRVLHLDVTDAPASAVGRLLVGSYITGQDQIVLSARGGLTREQRREIRRALDNLLGLSVVDDQPTSIEVQNFLDPTRYELPRLLHRTVELLRDELTDCTVALSEGRPASLDLLDATEAEIDRLYLLMARQLLLSSEDTRIARDVDAGSPHYQVGYRLVAKALEMTGDLVYGIGDELRQNLEGLRRLPEEIAQELGLRLRRLRDILGRTMDAFASVSVLPADATLNRITEALRYDTCLAPRIARSDVNPHVAVAAQRIALNLTMALEMLGVVNEVTLNRSVEPRPTHSGRSDVSVVVGPVARGRANAPR
jgi:phosphate uptake regulator